MPNTIEKHLTQIDHQLARGQREEPERLLAKLISQMGPAELSDWRPDILKMVDQFQKKRRRNLRELIENALHGNIDKREAVEKKPTAICTITLESEIVSDFRHALDKLRERHIYQWSTFYRDCLTKYFELFLDEMKHLSPDDPCQALSAPLAEHSLNIFSQGYEYIRSNPSRSDPIDKSINGLSKFLELPLDFYSVRLSSVSDYRSAFALRLLVSAAVSGILKGYSEVQFGTQTGKAILPRFRRTWVHYTAFLTPYHAEGVINHLEPGPLCEGLKVSVLPLLDAVQKFFDRKDEDYFPLPISGQYSWHQRRLDITVRPPRNAESQRFIEANAFLEEGFISTADLTDALGRQVALVIAPLRPDVRKIVEEREGLTEIVVATDKTRRAFVANQAFQIWDDAIFALRSKRKDTFPITYNFAREFPLHDPNKAKFFHVVRTSVRDLLRTFERRNGVRLWCSVRRSGKTTACFDLGSATGDSIIVSQTCGATQAEGANVFYERVAAAVELGKRISRTFVMDVVLECAPIDIKNRRMVLVIDEYETFFGLLKSAMRNESPIRYTVVQPILDQLLSFSYDNLLVFLGQQPDAHFILMDQNQLAPYVEQDSFPLFEHTAGTTTGEFSELVRKILAGRIDCTARFMDAVFAETAGHPFLTANVLGEFVDWLIEKERPQVGLRVDKTDFSGFANRKLGKERIEMSVEYEFFRNAAASAMSEQGYRDNPWLYTVYWVLHLLSRDETKKLRLKLADFEDLTKRIPIPNGGSRLTSAEILRTASQTNFLSYDNRGVSVKIRTLGRITSIVRPALS